VYFKRNIQTKGNEGNGWNYGWRKFIKIYNSEADIWEKVYKEKEIWIRGLIFINGIQLKFFKGVEENVLIAFKKILSIISLIMTANGMC